MEKLKYIKLILGTVAAIAIASLLSLKYAYSAGIITLLTIQDTKRETVLVTGKRLVIFAAMTLLSIGFFSKMGYHLYAFGVILIPYLLICMVLNMKEAIAPIAVLCTHYISEKSCSPDMIWNEFLILLIGAGIGIILNLFFSDKTIMIRKKQAAIEEKMRGIFAEMAGMIEYCEGRMSPDTFFDEIDRMLTDLRKEALAYINNHFLSGNDYYYNYVLMRMEQCRLLKQIYQDILSLDMVPEQAGKVADYFREIAHVFHESNNAEILLEHLNALYQYFENDQLPTTRKEFENRARLYHIMETMKSLVVMKQQFYRKNEQYPKNPVLYSKVKLFGKR